MLFFPLMLWILCSGIQQRFLLLEHVLQFSKYVLVTPSQCPLPGPGLSVTCLQALWMQAGCMTSGLQYPSAGNTVVLQTLSTLTVR